MKIHCRATHVARFALAFASIAIISRTVRAANLTVAQGDAVTLSDGDSYDSIIVNGTLTIPENAVVTAESLVVATNIAGDAYVTLASGSTLTLSGSVHLGYEGGQAHLDVKGNASLTVNGAFYMAYGHSVAPSASADPTRAYLTVSGATVTIKGSDGLYFYHSQHWPSLIAQSESVDIVRLEGGGVLRLNGCGVKKNGEKGGTSRSSTIVFAGGRIEYDKRGGNVLSHNDRAYSSYINLVSEEGNPIWLKAVNTGSSSYITWFGIGSTASWYNICGDLVLEQTTSHNFGWTTADKWDKTNPNVKFLSEGRVRLVRSNLLTYPENAFSSVNGNNLRSLVLENGATFDMNGTDAAFASVYGMVCNSGASCVLTMGGDDGDVVFPFSLPSNVMLVKAGSGSLSLFAADMSGVSLQGGALTLLGRKDIGYPFYRFNVYATPGTGGSNHRARISEFKFLDGENDVTQGWAAYYYDHTGTSTYCEPTAMWDSDTATDFYDQRAQNWLTVSNIHATLEYRPSRKVTGYTWHVSGSSEWNDRRNSYPTNWAVFASTDNATWTRLDLVDGFIPSGANQGQWCGTNFVCRYVEAASSIGSLNVRGNSKLSVRGVEVDFSGAAFAQSSILSVVDGGRAILPHDTEIANLEVDVDSTLDSWITGMTAASTGKLVLKGSSAKIPKSLPLVIEGAANTFWNGWTVIYNGERIPYVPKVADGRLRLQSTKGFCVICR